MGWGGQKYLGQRRVKGSPWRGGANPNIGGGGEFGSVPHWGGGDASQRRSIRGVTKHFCGKKDHTGKW